MRFAPTTLVALSIGAIAIAVAVHSAAQDDATVFSGPQVGEKLPPLTISTVYGKDSGKTINLIEMASGRPSLLIVVNGTNRPAASLTRCLMNFAEMKSESLFAGVVYLDNDPSKAEQYLRQATSWWGIGPPLGISTDGPEGPGSYGLNRNVNLTILVANKGRVTANFALIQPSMVDAPKILKEVVGLIGGEVPKIIELDYLSMPTQKPGIAPFPVATTDVRLRRLICSALAAKDAEQAASAAKDVEAYASAEKSLLAVLGNTSSAMLDGHTKADVVDQPITKYLQKWRDAHSTTTKQR